MRKLILYISCSLEGYIAKPNDDLSFLEKVQKEGEDYGYAEFCDSTDTVIVGRKTYEWVVNQDFEYHANKKIYVITRTEKPANGNVEYYSGNMAELLEKLKSQIGKNIYCDGGAEIVNMLLKEKLIDEIILSIIPIVLGSGVRLFNDQRPEQDVKLISNKTFDTGLVQLHYVF